MASLFPSGRPGRIAGLARRLRRSAGEAWADEARRRRLVRRTAAVTLFAIAVAVFFALFSWDWFKGPLERYASMRTHRTVRIEGHLHVHPFSLRPRVSVDGLRISQPAWNGGSMSDMADVGRVTIQAKLLPLLVGRLELPLLDIDKPRLDLLRDKRGRDNWSFGPRTGHAASLPPIEQFVVRDGRLHMADRRRGLVFDGTVGASEGAQGSGAQGFRLDGRGTLNATPFMMRITGGALLHVRRDRPYGFDATIRSGVADISVKGQIVRPFDFGRVRGSVTMSGRDLSSLYLLTGVTLPNTPPYRLTGRFERNDQNYSFPSFEGRVGDSDLGGALSVDKSSGRPFLKADLRSRSLDFKDLGALFGESPAARTAPTPAAKAAANGGRLLPDATLQTERVRAMDADVRYHAASVKARSLPLRAVDLHLTLDHGVLKMDPFAFSFPRGQARGTVRLDARKAVPVTSLDMRVSRLRVEDFVKRVQGLPVMEAPLEARARLTGTGNSVHRAAASSNGAVTVVLEGGQIRKALAELMGVNVVPGLIELLSKDPKQTDLRCAVASFDVRDGVMTPRRMVLDTGVVLLTGSGSINLRDESVDLTFKGQSKKPRLVHVIAPFHIRGRLASPKFSADLAPAAAQVGIAAALGAVLSPLAAILPFLGPGGAHDVDCAALMAEARGVGAPARPSAVPAARR